MENKNIIIVEHSKQKDIARAFGVTPTMVSQSLKGRRNSDLAKKIRYVAMSQYDGKQMQLVEAASY